MKKKVELTREEIIHLAKLANLNLSEEEIKKYQKQLSHVLEYINKLNQLDTEKVTPISHITGSANVFAKDEADRKRLLTQEDVLRNAKSKKNGFIAVRAIFDQQP